MPLCKCSKCLASTNGVGKKLHRMTIARHMKNEQMKQYLDDAYQSKYSFQNSEEERRHSLHSEDLYSEEEQ